MRPVVTVTLNAAVDLTVGVDGFRPGAVNRAVSVVSNAGGKGVNVAGCAADWGAAVTATGLIGRGNDGIFAGFFAAKGIADRFVRIAGDTRTNVKIADLCSGETTDLNMPGPAADAEALAEVAATALAAATPGAPVALAGSLPAGLAPDSWARLARTLGAAGARVVVDTSGPALAAVLAAAPGDLPYAVKPNRHELEEWAGRPIADRDGLVEAAAGLVRRGIGLVVVSLGADGALFVRAGAVIAARLPAVRAESTVGAGDAMVAGLVTAIAEDLDPEATARRAVAFAAAKLGRIGPHLPAPDVVRALADAAEITRLAG
ncbi:1-phosphofructokinase [Oharaeibacter diazotrophicus]|uniref:Phosphofructokinase n=2 Tax=Oharaeibacter diazotrophicus TaxID=1920512 RepID=A0A4R6R622_9HYPH|nr:1-phosphofructokinase [Oharaeibacter diazotrophicus]TDP81204.1 fructose-1-phosphate kinase [Oharaeibacter diazotrophicus]GLS75695.1 phosphofructokinase [Oharaeibacter diazotrophicus]